MYEALFSEEPYIENDIITPSDTKRIFSSIPSLRTDSLLMRRIISTDTDDMYDYSCREDVTRYLLWSPHPSRDYTRRYINSLQSSYRGGYFYDWGLEHIADGRFIGTCGFTSFSYEDNCAEIGYVINPDYSGRGYATEAVETIIAFGFGVLRLNRIEARYMVGNDASRRVMEKCGMTFEGIRRQLLYVKGEYRDVGTCAILRRDYHDPGRVRIEPRRRSSLLSILK